MVDTLRAGAETAVMASGMPLLVSRLYIDLLRVGSAL
jgi:hypothetical protein